MAQPHERDAAEEDTAEEDTAEEQPAGRLAVLATIWRERRVPVLSTQFATSLPIL